MFGNALLFISNPYFNTCLRVDAVLNVSGLEKIKTFQGFLHDDELTPMYEFGSVDTEHIALNELNKVQFDFIEFCNPDNPDERTNYVTIEVKELDMLDYLKEVFTYAKGIKETQNIGTIYTLYLD